MLRSDRRILTTHTGSLPRPPDLVESLYAKDEGQEVTYSLEPQIREAVTEVVRKQVATGIDVVNDGEAGRVGFAQYVRERLTGFDGESSSRVWHADVRDFPTYAKLDFIHLVDRTWEAG
jgi:5-methyltetrahydropteroyltriglutamate--homocysteine methyltransferase